MFRISLSECVTGISKRRSFSSLPMFLTTAFTCFCRLDTQYLSENVIKSFRLFYTQVKVIIMNPKGLFSRLF